MAQYDETILHIAGRVDHWEVSMRLIGRSKFWEFFPSWQLGVDVSFP